MNQFAPILPELILTLGGIVLMMVAAFGGRSSTGFVSWTAVAVLVGATFALMGAPSHAGGVFGGLTIDETAHAMSLHPATVNREWAHATAWLKQHVFARD